MALWAAVPVLSVDDLPAALDEYQRVLGFAKSWVWGDPPELASVCRDRVELNLAQRGKPCLVRAGEMAVAEKALRMDPQFAVAAFGGNRLHTIRGLALQGAAWSDDGDTHRHSLFVLAAVAQ